MKFKLTTFIFCLQPLLGAASEVVTTQIICDDTTKIVNSLKEEYKEMPIVVGKAADEAASIMTLWVNHTTNSWTILSTKNDLSCVVGYGQNLKIVPYSKKNNT